MNGPVLVCIQIIILIIIYDALSIGLTFYQKYFVKDFHFPLTIVIGHVILKFLYAYLIRKVVSIVWKRGNPHIDMGMYWKTVIPTGISSGLDIGLSNWSFEFITVSLYTMSKSSCIIFIFIFSILLKLDTLKISNVMTVSLIAIGLFLFTYQSTQFNWKGFILVMIAAMVGGARWSFAQLVTQHHKFAIKNPLDVIYYVQPWMLLILFPLALIFEGKFYKTVFAFKAASTLTFIDPQQDVANSTIALITSDHMLKIFFGSLIAFAMELSEYILVMQTSGLTLGISGILKEILTLYLASKYNGDYFSDVNFAGLIICLSGIFLHVIFRFMLSESSKNDDSLSSELFKHLFHFRKRHEKDDKDRSAPGSPPLPPSSGLNDAPYKSNHESTFDPNDQESFYADSLDDIQIKGSTKIIKNDSTPISTNNVETLNTADYVTSYYTRLFNRALTHSPPENSLTRLSTPPKGLSAQIINKRVKHFTPGLQSGEDSLSSDTTSNGSSDGNNNNKTKLKHLKHGRKVLKYTENGDCQPSQKLSHNASFTHESIKSYGFLSKLLTFISNPLLGTFNPEKVPLQKNINSSISNGQIKIKAKSAPHIFNKTLTNGKYNSSKRYSSLNYYDTPTSTESDENRPIPKSNEKSTKIMEKSELAKNTIDNSTINNNANNYDIDRPLIDINSNCNISFDKSPKFKHKNDITIQNGDCFYINSKNDETPLLSQ